MKRFLVLLITTAAFSQRPTYEVKELSAQQQSNIDVADAAERTALQKLQEANRAYREAFANRQRLDSEISAGFGAYEGKCSGGSQHIRSVEIKGKFALISESDYDCSATDGGYLITTTDGPFTGAVGRVFH